MRFNKYTEKLGGNGLTTLIDEGAKTAAPGGNEVDPEHEAGDFRPPWPLIGPLLLHSPRPYLPAERLSGRCRGVEVPPWQRRRG